MDYALITGSSSGLGYCIAKVFAKHGITPILTGRDQASLNRAANFIQRESALNPIRFAGNLTDDSIPMALHRFICDQGITPRYLVHNLGGGIQGDCKNPPLCVLRKSFRLNFEVSIEINSIFYDDLKKTSAKIVHIGSTSSLHHDAPPSYLTSKSAILPYVKNAARSFAKDGLTIFAVLPGMLDHPGSYVDRLRIGDPDRHDRFLEKMTYGQFVPSIEVAHYIVSLCLVESNMINGSIITIDGGVD
ncbi:SDR family oxidoreductase [Allochromatium vinosum]|uniref:Dehydrogenase with different specificities (Related to short-chain alcohol dehydrogenase) n=1 Tax=Allochromatium vinosum (strain ATCC 17899 / DSM 180 / NBRC 103801 / NCIMB 10441 / D) TaxID=572477 RepID=D3RUK7_ALLVD|nr:SDR family oxidoreductase [Allochromatium vinosum]ADC62866.1 Dehydrogenase with different specificities (related to short-chain alcohol dehydrogenase) [Allochromatium vinosum DSM 180]